MAAAAILKIGLMAISRPLLHIFARNFIQGLKTIPHKPFCRQKFNSRKIQDGGGRHFEIHFNGHNSVIVEHIHTKFGTKTKKDAPKTVLPSDFTSEKIQDGGGRHFDYWFKGPD